MPNIFIYGRRERLGNYVAALDRAGCQAVCSLDAAAGIVCDGLLLPGGGDIDPTHYGQKNRGSEPPDALRDAAELALTAQFLSAKKPVLGICRGMQVLNVALGGTLWQDLPGHSQVANADILHTVESTPGSDLFALYGAQCTVNSAHHQAVDRLGEGLEMVQRAPDGVVEALAHKTLPLWAVQWHPERLTGRFARRGVVDGGAIFALFARAVRAGKGEKSV